RRHGSGKRRRIEPFLLRLGPLGVSDQVRPVDGIAAQTERVRAVVGDFVRRAGLRYSNTGKLPSAQRFARKHRAAGTEEWEPVVVVGAEDVTAVEHTRSTIVLQVKRVRNEGLSAAAGSVCRSQVAARNIDFMREGVGELSGQVVLVGEAQSRLQGVVVSVGRAFDLGDSTVSLEYSVQVLVGA